MSEAELRGADEILLGAATREVQPVTSARWQAGGDRQARPGVAQAVRCLPGLQARDRGDAMVKDISGDGDELLKFPVAYPIKVVGRRSDNLRANIDAIVREHVPDLEAQPDHRARKQPGSISCRSPTPSTPRAASRSSRSPPRCRRART